MRPPDAKGSERQAGRRLEVVPTARSGGGHGYPPQSDLAVLRAGIYTRISWDPDGQRAGVERQRVDCEALCADRGWEIAQYFEDNDRLAYSGKGRPAYERLLAAVNESRVDAVVTWHTTACTARPGNWRPLSTL